MIRAKEPMHGRLSRITHTNKGVFHRIPQKFNVVRYHSLVVSAVDLPSCLQPIAWSTDGTIMGLRHVDKELHGDDMVVSLPI